VSVRGCERCGYNLAGLPASGTVVSCPECAHANDLAIPLQSKSGASSVFFWDKIPAALCALCVMLDRTVGTGSGRTTAMLFVAGLIGGALTAAVLTYKLMGREPQTGQPMRPRWRRLVHWVNAAVVSLVVNAALLIILLVAFGTISLR